MNLLYICIELILEVDHDKAILEVTTKGCKSWICQIWGFAFIYEEVKANPNKNSSMTVLPTQPAPCFLSTVTISAVWSAGPCVFLQSGLPNPVTCPFISKLHLFFQHQLKGRRKSKKHMHTYTGTNANKLQTYFSLEALASGLINWRSSIQTNLI